MHYRNDAFTKNGFDTIVAKNEPNLKFGQRIKFSVGDVQEINRLYNCHMKGNTYKGLFKDYSGKLGEKRKRDKKKMHDLFNKFWNKRVLGYQKR